MNAHHKKRRKSQPQIRRHVQYLSTGSTLPPSSTTAAAATNLKDDVVRRSIERVIFGWQFDAVIPSFSSSSGLARTSSTPTLATELKRLICDQGLGSFYYCTSVNLADLLTPDFLNSYIRTNALQGIQGFGNLMGLSFSTDAQEESRVCIDTRGRLFLVVSKSTYEILGLQGRPSLYNRGSDMENFVIEINMRDESFRNGRKGFERIKAQLRNWPVDSSLFDSQVSLSHDPHQSQVTGNSVKEKGKVGKTFDMIFQFVDVQGIPQSINFPENVVAYKKEAFHTNHILKSIRIPKIDQYLSPESVHLTNFETDEPNVRKAKRRKHGSDRNKEEQSSYSRETMSRKIEQSAKIEELDEWLGLVQISFEEAKDETEDHDLMNSSSLLSWSNTGGTRQTVENADEYGVRIDDCAEGQAWIGHWTGFFHPKTMAYLNLHFGQYLSSNALANQSSIVPFIHFSLRSHPSSPMSHLSSKLPSKAASRKKSNGKRRKRGKGQGEEEEADGHQGAEYGWSVTMWQTKSSHRQVQSNDETRSRYLLREGH